MKPRNLRRVNGHVVQDGYRPGKGPPPPDVTVSAAAIAQAGAWIKMTPEGKRLMCEGLRHETKSVQSIDDMIDERNAWANNLVQTVQAMWACLFAEAVPVVPELHPRRLEALVRWQGLTAEERLADAKEALVKGEAVDTTPEAIVLEMAEQTGRTAVSLGRHYPSLAVRILKPGGLAARNAGLEIRERVKSRGCLYVEEPCGKCEGCTAEDGRTSARGLEIREEAIGDPATNSPMPEPAPEPTLVEPFDCTLGQKPPNDARLVASYDTSEPYETDQGELYLLADGRYYNRWASGCSCWDGEWSSEEHASFAAWVQFGAGTRLSDFKFEKDFEHLKAGLS